MRIRNRSLDTTPISYGPYRVETYSPPSTLVSVVDPFNVGGSLSLIAGSEYIEDSSSPNRKGVNWVTHKLSKIERTRLDVTDDTNNVNTRYKYIGPMAHYYSWGGYGVLTDAHVNVSWASDMPTLVRQAVHKFRNENEVDNLLNLVEAPQLPASLINVKKLLTKRKYFQALTSAHLGYSFGVAPLRSDMITMTRAFPKIRDGFKRALKDSEDLITVRARAGGKLTLTPSGTGYHPTPNGPGWWRTIGENLIVPPIQTVVLVGRRDRPKYYNSTLQKVDEYLRRYLSAGPASFLWERLPYSFVVDWFVDTSGIVDSLNESLTGLKSDILRLSYSQKWHLEPWIQKIPTSSWPTSDSDYTITARNTIKYYHRESVNTQDILGTSGRFGKKQLALSASLLHQMVAKMKSRR